MISPHFYNSKNLVKEYLDAKIPHFAVKKPSVVIDWYNYTILSNETIFSIAERVFGKGLSYMWTYIADANIPRHPDDWSEGDTIRLPRIIVRDSDTQRQEFKTI